MKKQFYIIPLFLLVLICSIFAAEKVSDKPGKFIHPKIMKVNFKSKLLQTANTDYNQNIDKLKKTYQDAVQKEREAYLKSLKAGIFDKTVQRNTSDLTLAKQEMDRITLELDPSKNPDILDKSADFKVGTTLEYTVYPTTKWIKIMDGKKGDIVMIRVSGKMSKDITKAPLMDYKANGGSGKNQCRPHYLDLRVDDLHYTLKKEGLISHVKDKNGNYLKYTLERDGIFCIGYHFRAKDYYMNPYENGKGRLKVKIKVIRK